jgi:hypothetical protein
MDWMKGFSKPDKTCRKIGKSEWTQPTTSANRYCSWIFWVDIHSNSSLSNKIINIIIYRMWELVAIAYSERVFIIGGTYTAIPVPTHVSHCIGSVVKFIDVFDLSDIFRFLDPFLTQRVINFIQEFVRRDNGWYEWKRFIIAINMRQINGCFGQIC